MKHRRTIILAVIAALTVMALAGTPTASANGPTQLCAVHTGLTCEGGAATVNLVNQGVVTFLTSLINVLCLGGSATLLPLALGSPQVVHTLGIALTNCGTTSGHNNCTVKVDDQSLFDLLKTGLDQGVLSGLSGDIYISCENVDIFGIDIECTYSMAGLTLGAGSQHFTANEALLGETTEGALCPDETFLDALLKTTSASTEPSLCKVHTDICKTENLVSSIDMKTTSSPVLLNAVANIECGSSLAAITVLDQMLPSQPIKLDTTELTWASCKASGNNCTVTSKGLPTLNLTRTALNLGQATGSGLKVSVTCAGLELECVFGSEVTLAFEGALHTGGAGHGRFTASEAVLSKLEGGGNCPASVKWDASYELPEHTYLGPALTGGNVYILS